ncbi:DJ-1/PfpI family protein [Leptotrichia sp. oral taxon 417]|jgi:thiJ/pfpI family protein|uniref:DJ-1/PfpI family protein n=1 Tax=Leptotrichia sp. oral taxon 417 TaxID=712365 RepID=UPI0015B82BA7|nr:DJ-1/PfpI family protein [Leptotrichia sp. oral taxon 417]NWO27506.1 DJ-1/PfpI family protein [Leptotrichia sp. oral taxon 417]
MKNIVFVILDEFADWEAAFLSSALNDKNITKNYTTNFASIDKNLKKSMGNLKVLPDLTLKEIDENDVDGLVLIGGRTWRSQIEETNTKIVELVKKFKNNPNKVVGAICDAAYFLATNGLLNDRKHTVNSFDEIKDNSNYTNSKNFVEMESVIDGNLVTAKGDSPIHFAKNVMMALGDIPEKNVNLFFDIYTIGFVKAFEKISK